MNAGPLQEQLVLSATKSSHQSLLADISLTGNWSLGRWLSGEEWLLCKPEELSLNSWHPHKKLGMAARAPSKPSAAVGRNGKIAGAC